MIVFKAKGKLDRYEISVECQQKNGKAPIFTFNGISNSVASFINLHILSAQLSF